MRLDIQGSAVSRRVTVRRHVEQRALFELARYGTRIDVVRLRVTERPPSAEHPFHCAVGVTVAHDDGTTGNVLARAEGDDVFRLVDAVLERAASQIGGELERAAAAAAARAEWTALVSARGDGRSA